MDTGFNSAERKVIIELTELLRKNEQKVLSGETNLCLTTSSLSILGANFRRYSESAQADDSREDESDRSKNKRDISLRIWQENIRTLFDFVIKVRALKVIHSSQTMKAAVQINRFRSLQVLELKKVPIHMVEGLSRLRLQLSEITVCKSIQTLKDLLETCGADRTPGLVWTNLKKAFLSFNMLQALDESLNCVPFIETMDLSHNSITKTGDFLVNLAEIMRINFGYNLLKQVPQFSSRNKLKTLIVRNNNLESLEGVECLLALEELDAAENFLLDHKVLSVLFGLKKLQLLCLVGNPMSYRTNHRQLTLQYICPQAGLGVFELDARRLSPEEVTILQQNHFKRMDSDIEVIVNPGGQEDITDSKAVVTQLSPTPSRKKRGHRRVLSKERIPNIADIEKSMMPESGSESIASTYKEEPDIDAQRLRDEEYFKTLREHYKDDWLKALTATQKPAEESSETVSAEEKSKQHIHESESKDDEEIAQHIPKKGGKKKGHDAKSGSGKLDNLHIGDKTDSASSPKNKDAEAEPVVESEIHAEHCSPVTSPTSPEGVIIKETTDIYSLSKPKKLSGFYSQESVDTLAQPVVDSSEQYGEESEPFILMLPDDDMRHLFVTVNRRFITEKDFKGVKLGALDLKCLKNVRKSEEKCYGPELIGGFIFTILTLDFDYVKKEMRQRRYAMESDQDALRFEELLSPHLPSKVTLDKMECLKCQHKFSAPPSDNGDILKCPNCKSKMVIKSEQSPLPVAIAVTTVQKAESSDSDVERQFSNRSQIRRHSSTRRSTRRPASWREQSHLGLDEPDCSILPSSAQTSEDTFGAGKGGESLKDYVDRLMTDKGSSEDNLEGLTNTSKESVNTSSLNDQPTRVSSTPTMQSSAGIPPNASWSDVRRSGILNSGPRESVSSVESDITVLATQSSRGSITVISDSSKEIVTSSSSYMGQQASVKEPNLESRSVTSSNVPEISSNNTITCNGVDWRKTNQGLLTPVGSPLSNSVCSSMVCSVYENTLAGSGEEKDDGQNTQNNVGNLSNMEETEIPRQFSLRSSKSRSKEKKSHRGVTVYDNSSPSSQNRSTDSSFSKDDASESDTKPAKKEPSIYDPPDSALSNISLSGTPKSDANKSNIPSIYDVEGSDLLDSTENESHNLSRSHDHSVSQNSMASSSLSLEDQNGLLSLRRGDKSSSRGSSRSSSKNRSAAYYDDSVHDSRENSQNGSVPEFPSDLSPIKRSRPSYWSGGGNRNAVMMGGQDDVSLNSNKTSDDSVPVFKHLNETNDSYFSTKSSESSLQLPWEQAVSQLTDNSKQDESLNHEEFVNMDHNIKLHLELHVFKAEETAQCAIQCNIVQYMKMEEMKSLLVISTHRIIIFRMEGESASADWLKSYEDQPISELRYIDIGLGYQTLRLEFETVCSSYTLLIADESRCKKFLTLISDIVQREALSEHSRLEGIVKSNPATFKNLEDQVLQVEGEDELQQMIRFLMVKYLPGDSDGDFLEVKSFMSLVVTETDVVLVLENHQWPLPRLQSPLPEEIKGRQFTVTHREKINNIETLFFNEYNPTELRLTFFESTAADQSSGAWLIAFESFKGVKSFVDAIREPWEKEFGVTLDILSTSFTDMETSGNAD